MPEMDKADAQPVRVRPGGPGADPTSSPAIAAALAADGLSGGMRSSRNRSRLADEVYDTLLSQLMSLRIEPGSRVTIDALVRELGVSQTPIRHALNRLESDGLVVRIPLAGYRIAPQITREHFEEMVELRLLLEPPAARRAAENMTPEETAHLRRLWDDMASPAEGDHDLAYGAFGRMDAEFHDLIAAGGGNRLIRESLSRLHTHVHLFRLLYDAKVTRDAIAEHEDILAGITSRDPDAAAFAMRQHILRSSERFRPIFER
jgi:DNA-binding GntR family transcriptional regulator